MDLSATRLRELDEGARDQYKNGPAARMMHLPHSLTTLPVMTAIADATSAPAPAPWQVSASHLRMVMLLLDVSVREFERSLSTFPVPHKHYPTHWGGPRKIGDSLLSRWLGGKVPMPEYRLAGALALLELIGRQVEGRWQAGKRATVDAQAPGVGTGVSARVSGPARLAAVVSNLSARHARAPYSWIETQSDEDRALYDAYTSVTQQRDKGRT